VFFKKPNLGPNINDVILAAAKCGDGKIFVAADDWLASWILNLNL